MSKQLTSKFQDQPCCGKNLEKLIQPAILAILAEGNLHGYKIMQRLADMPMLQGKKPDCTGIYRCLKNMESRGVVNANWDLSEAGPAKRCFSLTPTGMSCLQSWIETLRVYRQSVTKLLNVAKKAASKSSPKVSGSGKKNPGKSPRKK